MAHDIGTLTLDELANASQIYELKERRAGAYWEALDRVNSDWPNMEKVSNGIIHLLRSWLRFQSKIDPTALSQCLESNRSTLEEYRPKSLLLSDEKDIDDRISRLFAEIEIAQRSTGGKSPVGTGKTLALLAPAYFPLWDTDIAFHYGCSTSPVGYLNFMRAIQELARKIVEQHSRRKGLPTNEAWLHIEDKCSFGPHKKNS